jgi:hypothetical protein
MGAGEIENVVLDDLNENDTKNVMNELGKINEIDRLNGKFGFVDVIVAADRADLRMSETTKMNALLLDAYGI